MSVGNHTRDLQIGRPRRNHSYDKRPGNNASYKFTVRPSTTKRYSPDHQPAEGRRARPGTATEPDLDPDLNGANQENKISVV